MNNFLQPAPGQTITIPTVKLRVFPGMVVFHENGGYYRVSAYNGTYSITLRNLGIPPNPNPGSIIDTHDSALVIAGEPGISVVETPGTRSECGEKLPSTIGVMICQAGHGFQTGDALYIVDSLDHEFAKATALHEETSLVAGLVQMVVDANKFILVTGGMVRFLPTLFPSWAPNGLERGVTYYLSDVPGQLTKTPGSVERPLLVGYSLSAGFFDTFEGGATEYWNDATSAIAGATPGTSTRVSRGDHTHEHGDQGRGSQHQTATESEAGFMAAADKTKLDGVQAGAKNIEYSNVPPNAPGDTALPGLSDLVSRGDHIHPKQVVTISDVVDLVSALAAKVDAILLGAANGVATLGADTKLTNSQIPQAVLGSTKFMGLWDADANSTNPNTGGLSAPPTIGQYWIVSNPGATNLSGITDWKLGDWALSIGTAWTKVDNTDAVVTVAGKLGIVTLDKNDVGLGNVDNTSDANKPVSTAQATAIGLKQDALPSGDALQVLRRNATNTALEFATSTGGGADMQEVWMNQGL